MMISDCPSDAVALSFFIKTIKSLSDLSLSSFPSLTSSVAILFSTASIYACEIDILALSFW